MQPNYADVIQLAQDTGEAIMAIYNRSEYTIVEKQDHSPLTEADLAANEVLQSGLKQIIDIPIVSEENHVPDLEERNHWDSYWLIDPLDGTKEFIDRNGEFTINIALIEQGEPVFGLIHVPVSNECYYGGDGKAFKKVRNEPAFPIKPVNPNSQIRENNSIRLLASRRHALAQLDELQSRLTEKLCPVNRTDVGSALKLAYLASGQGDLYPRFGNVCEWDIAAGHAILKAVGGDILSMQYESISYGKGQSMIVPGFYAVGFYDFDWRPLLFS